MQCQRSISFFCFGAFSSSIAVAKSWSSCLPQFPLLFLHLSQQLPNIPHRPTISFLSYHPLSHCIKLKCLICISYHVPFLFCYSVAFPPVCPWWQPQCPLLLVSFFLYQMLLRSTPLSHVLYGDIKNLTSKWKFLLKKLMRKKSVHFLTGL